MTLHRFRPGTVRALAAHGMALLLGASGVLAADEAQRDLPATRFINTCAGCHSLSGARLNGPELSPVAAWPDDQLRVAIKRMEKHVGPLAEGDVTALAELLRDPEVRHRLKVEEARIQSQFTARLEPPSALVGERLFTGQTALEAGGLACNTCHAVGGRGGSLGPDLTDSHARMGELPLISSIEKASFKLMAPHYRSHPISRQEALHLTAYLAAQDPAAPTTIPASFVPLGAGGALAGFIGLALYFLNARKGRTGTLKRRVS